jgi:hypothetical protein
VIRSPCQPCFTNPHRHRLRLSVSISGYLQDPTRQERLRGGDDFHGVGEQTAIAPERALDADECRSRKIIDAPTAVELSVVVDENGQLAP